MLPQLHAAHPRSDRHSTATLRWMSLSVAATPETVQHIVTTLLPDGSPDIHTVAAMARMSVRTLQRRLHDQGVTFAWVVAGARLAMAQQMLVDPARKVIDVALDLGYSDPAHFTRAFVRWTGLAPREFRRLRSTGCLGGSVPAEPLAATPPSGRETGSSDAHVCHQHPPG
jgi:AraC-like DNA-binding protein